MLDKMYKTLGIEPFPVEGTFEAVQNFACFLAILGIVWGTIGSGMFVVWAVGKVIP